MLALMQDRIQRNQADLLAFFRRRVPNHAEELTQEVWLRVARSSPNCPTEAAFRAYMYTVARRLIIDHHRHQAKSLHLVSLDGQTIDPPASVDPHGELVARGALRVIEEALTEMRPEIAEVFRLRTSSQLTFKDIAARQHVGLNTALGRMHRATKHIHRRLLEAGYVDERGSP